MKKGAQNLVEEVMLLMDAILACRERSGLVKPIKLLRKSTGKDIPDALKLVKGKKSKQLLYGAGSSHSNEWWKVS